MKYKKVKSSKLGELELESKDFEISKWDAIKRYGYILCHYCGCSLLIRKGKNDPKKFALYTREGHSRNCEFNLINDSLNRIEDSNNVNIFFTLSEDKKKRDPYQFADKKTQTNSSSTNEDNVTSNEQSRKKALINILENDDLDEKYIISLDNPLIINEEEIYMESYIYKIIYNENEEQFHHYNGITRHNQNNQIVNIGSNDFITKEGENPLLKTPDEAKVNGVAIYYIAYDLTPKTDVVNRRYVRMKYRYVHHKK